MAKKKLAVIGNGMAASRLLDDLASRGVLGRFDVCVYGDEPGGAYNRMMLSKVLMGSDPDVVLLKSSAWYADHGVELIPALVDQLDPVARLIYAADGRERRYDVAVFATGSSAFIPPLQGLKRPDGRMKNGVFAYRTMDDCLQIRSSAQPGDNAVVVGGGLLGLEAAKALSDLGLHVTVVHLLDTLMNVQLDSCGGDMLRRQIENAGLYVRTGLSTDRILGVDDVEGVELGGGVQLPADLVVFACGVRPRVEVAKKSNIAVGKAILVNDALSTATPGVYAVGECAEHRGNVYGIVAPIYEQCAVLADVLSGANPQARYRGSKLYTRLKVAGVEVASMGALEPTLDTDEVVQILEPRRHAYRKLIVRDDRLIGAMLVGDAESAPSLVQAFDRGDPLPKNRIDAFCSMGAGGGGSAAPRTVCNCHKVSEADVVDAVEQGCQTVDALSECTRAGTGCGSCKGQLAQILARCAAKVGAS